MARQKKDGAKSFMAVIRKKQVGKIILTLIDTFPSRQAAEHWMKKTERNLKGKGALDRTFANSASRRRSADRKS
ncbi:hypothetical protein [Mameliella sp.]|uniref:hypothetical protein n=1 Tax=Mameliella sp. TaxID=1924940 RepID=UPI003BAB3587